MDYDKRRAAGYVAARLEYEKGQALRGLIRLVDYSVHLEEHIDKQNGRIDELAEMLRRISRECFENLGSPPALRDRTISRVMDACASVVEIPNFGAALSSEVPDTLEGEDG